MARAERELSLDHPAVIVKEPNGSHGAEFMMSLLPRARLVFLLRDGRDVIDSLMDAMSSGGWLAKPYMRRLESPEERLAFARSEARAWLERTQTVEQAFDAHPPELRWKVRYEELRASPLATLRPLVDWLGLNRSDGEMRAAVAANTFESIPSAQKGRGTQWRAATPGLWRQNMSDRGTRRDRRDHGPQARRARLRGLSAALGAIRFGGDHVLRRPRGTCS